MNKPILCIDFDGVIHSYISPWTNAETISDSPVPGAIEWLESLLDDFEVCIYSSRSKSSLAICEMKNWLYKYGMDWEDIERIKFPMQKPAAFLTIDDRTICFEGEFNNLTLKELLKFKPWNRRDV
jgi:hypothetical protein